MSWYTEVSAKITFCRETYNYKYDVESRVKELQSELDELYGRLYIIAASDPKNLVTIKPDETYDGEYIDKLKGLVGKALESIVDDVEEKQRLEYLLEDWEYRTGDFVNFDLNAKYNGESNVIFNNGEVYGVNEGKDYKGKFYAVCRNNVYEFVTLREKEFNELFEKVETEDEL